jgi:hypothetical protein
VSLRPLKKEELERLLDVPHPTGPEPWEKDVARAAFILGCLVGAVLWSLALWAAQGLWGGGF